MSYLEFWGRGDGNRLQALGHTHGCVIILALFGLDDDNVAHFRT